MTWQRASELLAMVKVEEQSELTVNSWWGSFEKDYKEALQMAIKALETVSCIKEKCIYCPHCENCEDDNIERNKL